MIKFHQKNFIESKPFKKIKKVRNSHNIENELTGFQIYQETELACKNRNPLYKTQFPKYLLNTSKVSI